MRNSEDDAVLPEAKGGVKKERSVSPPHRAIAKPTPYCQRQKAA